MNKYQEALDRQKNNVKKLRDKEFVEYRDDFQTLQELVDKATPKKVSAKWRTGYDPKLYYPKSFHCPLCSRQLRCDQSYKCCPRCGQALDWSDYN